MMIHIDLPKEVEDRLRAEVSAGRHATVVEAILEKVSRTEDPDLLAMMGCEASWLRRDLDDAWLNRDGAVDGVAFFTRIAARGASLTATDQVSGDKVSSEKVSG